MEAVELFGITFRSEHHLHWFIMTMMLFGASLLCAAICMWRKLYMGPFAIWGSLSFISFSTFMSAIVETKLGMVNGPVWSVDCIWYNGLLTALYLSCIVIYRICMWAYSKRMWSCITFRL